MARPKVICGTLNIKDFSIELFTTRNQIVDKIGCGKNYLNNLSDKVTYGDYIIFSATLSKCKKHPPKKQTI